MTYRELINWIVGFKNRDTIQSQEFYERARWQIAAIFGKKPTKIVKFPWENAEVNELPVISDQMKERWRKWDEEIKNK